MADILQLPNHSEKGLDSTYLMVTARSVSDASRSGAVNISLFPSVCSSEHRSRKL